MPDASELLGWLASPSATKGLHCFRDDAWRFVSYASLAELVSDTAAALARYDIARAHVCIVASDAVDFAKCFFGTLLAGGTPCPIAPPQVFADIDAYRAQLAHLFRVASPAVVLVEPDLRDLVGAVPMFDAKLVTVPAFEARTATLSPPSDVALLQFTSGSSGAPRAVRVTRSNLGFMIGLIRAWLRMTPEDATTTWLPLYHDMGLIGTLLTPIVNQSDLMIMTPYEFIQDPTRWLACMGRRGAVLTSAPNFAYALSARRVSASALEGMDFSRVRACIAGAERIDPGALEAFHALLASRGLQRSAFRPAYGLAEATLAVTGLPLGETPRVVRPARATVRLGGTLRLEAAGRIDEVSLEDGAGWLVGTGVAHPGVNVSIRVDGAAVGELTAGEIFVEGPLVCAGYEGEPPEGARFEDTRLATGDAGFFHEGQLFVLGRMGDSVKVRGRHVYAEDIETRLAVLAAVKRRCVVLPALEPDVEGFVLAVEGPSGDWLEEAVAIVRRSTHESARVRIVGVGERGILRTSSGKPRRRVMWVKLVADELSHEVYLDTAECS